MQRNQRQQGFGLIEVLIAIVILSVVMLSLLNLQLSSLQMSHESFRRTQAIEMIRGLADASLLNVQNFETIKKYFESKSQKIFPHANLTITHNAESTIVRIRWYSGKHFMWKCSSGRVQESSCLEVKVMS